MFKPSLFGFEHRIYLKGEILVRKDSLHDFFNALIWIKYPFSKALINKLQYIEINNTIQRNRTSLGDFLTHFDEDGMVVACNDDNLLKLIKNHEWKELFFVNKNLLAHKLQFYPFGHALFSKLSNPYVGITANSIFIKVEKTFFEADFKKQLTEIDRKCSSYLFNISKNSKQKTLNPIPVLGIPGWHLCAEKESFYSDKNYFRKKSK